MTASETSTGAPLAPLRPIAPSPRTASPSPPPSAPSTESLRLSKLATIQATSRRTLDFDVECVAAGFADPQWVPVRITAYAYAWVDEGDIVVDALPVSTFYDRDARRRFIMPLLAAIETADVVTGHNIVRADLRWLNAECMNLGLPTLPSLLVQDTIRLPRTGGFKKGQDNMSATLGIVEEKLPLNWAQWEAAYAEPDMATVKERVVGDVRQHMQMREAMRQRGWLRPPRRWNP